MKIQRLSLFGIYFKVITMKRSWLFLFFVFFLWACKDERSSVGFPTVTTESTVTIPETGGVVVTFNVEYLGSGKLNDCGIIYRQKSGDVNEFKLSLGSQGAVSSVFKVEINQDILPDIEYVVKAYAETDDHLVYGNEVSFVSSGGKSPEFVSITPIEADYGDTLSIAGRYFSTVKEWNKVQFGDKTVIPVFSTDTLLKVIVPTLTKASDVTISVTSAGKTSSYGKSFALLQSRIDSIVPAIVFRGDEVQLYGQNLRSLSAVKVGSYFLGLTENKGTSVRFKLYDYASTGTMSLSVIQADRVTNTEQEIQIVQPEILSVSPNIAWIDTVLQIKGRYMSRLKNVSIDGSWWDSGIISQTDTLIRMKVKSVFFEGQIYGYFLEDKIAAPGRISLNPPVIKAITPSVAKYGEPVTLTGDRFFNGLGTSAGELKYVSKNEMKLVVGSDLPAGATTISFNTYGYSSFPESSVKLTIPQISIVGFSKTEIWRGDHIQMTVTNLPYDGWHSPWVLMDGNSVGINLSINSDQIGLNVPLNTYLDEYPSVSLVYGVQQAYKTNAVHVIEPWSKPKALNDLGYPLFVYSEGNTYAFVNGYSGGTLYYFNAISEKWEYESTYSVSLQYCDGGKSVGNDLYFYGGVPDSESGVVYKYSPSLKQWSKLPDVPLNIFSVDEFVFGLNNQLFIGTGIGMYCYDENSKKWVGKETLPNSGNGLLFPCNFSISGKGYVASHAAASYDETPNVLWEYDPDTDSWKNLYASFSHILMFSKGAVVGNKAYLIAQTNENSYTWRTFEFDPQTKQIKEFLEPPIPLNYQSMAFLSGQYLYVANGNSISKILMTKLSEFYK